MDHRVTEGTERKQTQRESRFCLKTSFKVSRFGISLIFLCDSVVHLFLPFPHFAPDSQSGIAWSFPARSTHARVVAPSARSLPAARTPRTCAPAGPGWSASRWCGRSARRRSGPGLLYFTSTLATTRKKPWSSIVLVRRPERPQQLRPGLLEVDEVVRVVQQPHPVRLGVPHPDLDLAAGIRPPPGKKKIQPQRTQSTQRGKGRARQICFKTMLRSPRSSPLCVLCVLCG